jgi:prepilin-type processing-associated H-X9-DG protein
MNAAFLHSQISNLKSEILFLEKPYPMTKPSKRTLAFTLVELLVVLATLAILAVMVIPALARTGPSVSRLNCAANLKQIGLAFQNWRNAHLGLYPMNVLNSRGGPPVGTIALSSQAGFGNSPGAAVYTYVVFGVMSNELNTPKIVVCPSDERASHSNFTMSVVGAVGQQIALPSASGPSVSDNYPPAFNNFKLSYFLGVNATDLHPQMFLAGDRNILGDHTGSTVVPGWNSGGYGNNFGTQYWMGTNWTLGAIYPAWTPSKMHQSRGNVLLADGSVQQLDSVRLRQQLAATGDTTSTSGVSSGPNTLLFP